MNQTSRARLLVLGLLAPGLGALAAGRARVAWLCVALWFVLPMGAQMLAMEHAPQLFVPARLGLSLAVLVGGAAWAAVVGARDENKGYQHWWWLFGFGFLTWAATLQVQQRVVAPHIGFAYRVHQDDMGERLPPGTLVVLDPKRAARAGDVVLVTSTVNANEVPVVLRHVVTGAPNTVPARQAVGCSLEVTSLAAHELYLWPIAPTANSCGRSLGRVDQQTVLGVVRWPRVEVQP